MGLQVPAESESLAMPMAFSNHYAASIKPAVPVASGNADTEGKYLVFGDGATPATRTTFRSINFDSDRAELNACGENLRSDLDDKTPITSPTATTATTTSTTFAAFEAPQMRLSTAMFSFPAESVDR